MPVEYRQVYSSAGGELNDDPLGHLSLQENDSSLPEHEYPPLKASFRMSHALVAKQTK